MELTLDDRTVTLTDEQLTMFNNLTKLQRGVVTGSLGGMSPSDAHRNAGGKCRDEARRTDLASQILLYPVVVKFMDTFKVEPPASLTRAVMTRDDIISDLTDIANATIFDVARFYTDHDSMMHLETGAEVEGQTSVIVKSMSDIDPKHHKLIKGVKQTKYGIELTLHDQMQARKQITDMCGYDAPKRSEISGPGGEPIKVEEVTDEQLQSKLKELGLGRYHNQLGGKSV